MAASGINEHNEARRKQHFIDRSAYVRQQILDNLTQDGLYPPMAVAPSPRPSPRCEPGHDRASVDRQRREWVLKDQGVAYTAKIPNRYNSTMYNQQW